MRDVLVKAANAAFCMQNMNEWIWALVGGVFGIILWAIYGLKIRLEAFEQL
jgi:hypothetical protein